MSLTDRTTAVVLVGGTARWVVCGDKSQAPLPYPAQPGSVGGKTTKVTSDCNRAIEVIE